MNATERMIEQLMELRTKPLSAVLQHALNDVKASTKHTDIQIDMEVWFDIVSLKQDRPRQLIGSTVEKCLACFGGSALIGMYDGDLVLKTENHSDYNLSYLLEQFDLPSDMALSARHYALILNCARACEIKDMIDAYVLFAFDTLYPYNAEKIQKDHIHYCWTNRILPRLSGRRTLSEIEGSCSSLIKVLREYEAYPVPK